MSVTIPYVYQYEFEYATIQAVSPLVNALPPETLLASHRHRNLHHRPRHVAVIDPGPMIDEHIEALKAALAGRPSRTFSIPTHMDTRQPQLRKAWNTHLWLTPWIGQSRRRQR